MAVAGAVVGAVGGEFGAPLPRADDSRDIVLRLEGGFMGGNVALPIALVILVDPEPYSRLSLSLSVWVLCR